MGGVGVVRRFVKPRRVLLRLCAGMAAWHRDRRDFGLSRKSTKGEDNGGASFRCLCLLLVGILVENQSGE